MRLSPEGERVFHAARSILAQVDALQGRAASRR
jgi:DNA-binding transcriptional LysR family regulator